MPQHWDVVVVGGGSAGSAFAARTAERGRRVLLLEAGPDARAGELPSELRAINPLIGIASDAFGRFTWPGLLATRTASQAPWEYTRGYGLGGSSLINSIIAIRPPAADFDEWAAAGCTGWSFAEILPFLRRLEDDLDFGDAPFHGSGGPIPVHRPPVEAWGAVDRALKDAAIAHGFPWAEDLNAPDATGVSPYPVNARDGRRATANDGYLEPARALPGLEIRGGSLVDRVELEGDRAVGVRLAGGERILADAVVLAGGVVGSPTILQRSGIGPAGVLERAGIEIRHDLPVGEGWSDHVVIPVDIPLAEPHRADAHVRAFNCCIRYASGSGDLANDMMVISVNGGELFPTDRPVDRAAVGGLWVWVNRAYSRGSVSVRSADPTAPPEIRLDLLSDERDRIRLRGGVRLVESLLARPSFAAICEGDPWRINAPLRAALDAGDDALDAHQLANAIDTNHGTSTCRMGPADDAAAVVDPRGRVRGVEGLTVADASILPYCPRANTYLTAVLVGEVLAARFDEP